LERAIDALASACGRRDEQLASASKRLRPAARGERYVRLMWPCTTVGLALALGSCSWAMQLTVANLTGYEIEVCQIPGGPTCCANLSNVERRRLPCGTGALSITESARTLTYEVPAPHPIAGYPREHALTIVIDSDFLLLVAKHAEDSGALDRAAQPPGFPVAPHI
jgi:hypothetical protein